MKQALPIALLLLTGCTAVGPDYSEPTPPTVQHEQPSAPMNLAQWWEKFNDPTLTALMAKGLENSPTLEAALEHLRASRASRESTEAGYYPRFTSSGSYVWSRQWDGAQPSDDWNKNLNTAIDARWELDLFGGLQRSVEQALAREEQLAYTLQDVRVSLTAEIANAYIEYRRYAEQLNIAKENLTLQERSTQRLKRMSDIGDIPPYDYYSSEAQVARTRASIPTLQQNLLAAQLRIDLLTGQAPYATQALLTNSDDQMTFPEAVPQVIANEILRRRADIRNAESAIRAQTAAIGIATAELYPKFFLSGALGVSSPSLSSWNDYSKNVSIGPSFSWNLFGFGYWRKRIAAEEATLKATIADYTSTVLEAFQEAETAWYAYRNEKARTNDLILARDSTQKALNAAERRYEFGYTDIENVLTQQSNLLTAQENIVIHRATAFTNIVTLYKALGGGWSDTP